MYALFDRLAERYDLHTPPSHYQHDHAFVLQHARAVGPSCALLDVGCGTGVLVEKALQAGLNATGIDASPGMVAVAQRRVAPHRIALRRMQDLEMTRAYDVVASLSWTLNYCENVEDLAQILARVHAALRPGGRLLAQVAHSACVDGTTLEDREPGPTGIAGDVSIRYRFAPVDGAESAMRAEYEYACASLGEREREVHVLRATDVGLVADRAARAGFDAISVYDSFRMDPHRRSASPWVVATRGAAR